MQRYRSLVFALIAAAACAVPGAASAGTVSGSVDLAGGTAVEGALVVVMDRNGTPADPKDDTAAGADVTDANGDFSITTEASVANGETVTVVTTDAGTQPTSTAVTLVGAAGTVAITPTPSGTTFAALEIFGGQISRILPGGDPCEFYAATSVIPQIFVTIDCGGAWTPVTTQTDSSSLGLSSSSAVNANNVATSGVGGEVAALVNQTVYYSRDYGATWSAVAGSTGGGAGVGKELFWGHVAGGNDVMLVRDGLNTYTADLTATTPTFVTTTGYIDDLDDRISVAAGADHPYVAVANPLALSGSGPTTYSEVYTWRLQAGATPHVGGASGTQTPIGFSVGTAGDPLSGFALTGGTGSLGPPDVIVAGIVVVGNDEWRVFNDRDDQAGFFQVTRTVGLLPGNCAEPPQTPITGRSQVYPSAARRLTPRVSGGTGGIVVFGSCSAVLAGTGDPDATPGYSATGGQSAAIDPAWGTDVYPGATGPSRVMIAPQGDRGVQKSAQLDVNNVPQWPGVATAASAGVGSASGGIAVNGLTVPVVKDVAFGPAGAADVAVMFSTSGGGLCIASEDGLATQAQTKTLVRKGGNSVAWWTGSTGNEWLLCGHSGAGDILSAFNNWTSSVPTVNTPNVSSSSSAQHGIETISAIEGVTGTNTVWFGGSRSGATGDGRLIRAVLAGATGSVALSSIVQINADDPITDIEYCPAGSATGFADVLFLSTQDGANGGVYRIASASTATGSATPSLLTGSRTNGAAGVEVDCAAGVLWAGLRGASSGGAVIQKSTNGTSLSAVATPGINVTNGVTAIAVNPSSANELLFASDSEGFVYATVDGGSTWTTVNNARQFPGGVNFNSEGIAAMALPPGLTRSAAVRAGAFHERAAHVRALSSSSTAVGSGGGAYRASFRSSLTVPSGGGSGSGGSGSGGSGAGTGGGSGAGGGSAAPIASVRATLAIAGAKWDAKKKGIVATVTASAAGRVTLVVNLKQGAKLKRIASGAATVKAGANKAVLFKMKKPPRGSYTLAATHANGATAAGAIRVR